MKGIKRFGILTLSIGAAFLLFPRSALAYLDPATGSLIIQGLIGGLLATGFVIKLYWRKLGKILSGLIKGKRRDDAE